MRKKTVDRNPSPAENFSPRYAITIAAVLCVILLAIQRIGNPDIFFHITLGRRLLQGEWPPVLTDLYFTPISGHWIGELRQTFLGDVFFALADRWGGLLLVQFLGLALLAVGGAMLFRNGSVAFASRGSAAWHIQISLCAVFFVLGTLQLQIVRNAAFSLFFFPAAMVIAHRIFHDLRVGWIPGFVVLFALWSGFHGSYLLGMVAVAAMGLGALMDGMKRDRPKGLCRRMAVCAITLLLVIGVVSIANPAFKAYFSLPFGNLSSALGFDKSAKKTVGSPAPPTMAPAKKKPPNGHHKRQPKKPVSSARPAVKDTVAPAGFLSWLASPLWKRSDQLPASGDFLPSWQCWRYFPATIALLGGIAMLGIVLLSKSSERWTLALPLALTLYFGICYVRGTGYVAILALWCFMRWKITRDARISKPQADPGVSHQWTVAACLGLSALLFLLAAFQGRLGLVLGDRSRTFGFGTISTLDEKVCRQFAGDGSARRIFTTIWSGSFAQYCWNGKKQVFTDAFFPAHADAVWKIYREVQQGRSLAPLSGPFAVDSALIENSRLDWQTLFWNDAEWAPVLLGTGMTCYRHISPGAPLPPCEVLFDSAELKNIPNDLIRHDAAALLLNFQRMNLARALEGRPVQPLRMTDATLSETAKECLDPIVQKWVNRKGAEPQLIPLF